MFNTNLYFPDLNNHPDFRGRTIDNIEPKNRRLGRLFDKTFPFVSIKPRYCDDLFATLSIKDDGYEVGAMKVSVSDESINIINSCYIFPQYRNQGYFKRLMNDICKGQIRFVLRPQPHYLYREDGKEAQNADDIYYADKAVDDTSQIERITDTYLRFGLKRAKITDIDREYLTSYERGDHKRVIIQE
jgi:GNAT superfamily N-acetyltransferase